MFMKMAEISKSNNTYQRFLAAIGRLFGFFLPLTPVKLLQLSVIVLLKPTVVLLKLLTAKVASVPWFLILWGKQRTRYIY